MQVDQRCREREKRTFRFTTRELEEGRAFGGATRGPSVCACVRACVRACAVVCVCVRGGRRTPQSQERTRKLKVDLNVQNGLKML